MLQKSYKVIPNLSLKGKDIRERLRNGTLKPKKTEFNAELNDAMTEFLKLDKPGRINHMMGNSARINTIKDTLKPKK